MPDKNKEVKQVSLEETTFSQMVKDLFKDPAVILEELDEGDVAIIHAALGLVTEARELVIAVFNKDIKNLHEEVGDFAFYSEAMRQAIDDNYDLAPRETLTLAPTYDVTSFLLQTMNVVEYVKPAVIYRREVDMNNVLAILDELDVLLLGICNTHGVSVSEAMDANKVKLLTKRYPNGYSDQSANERADKKDA